jgi:hypothetical protein
MSAPCLACDISTRNLGWCASVAGGVAPEWGLILLPGMSDLGKLYGAVRNSLCDLVERFQPRVLAWCMPTYSAAQTTARALNGVAAVAALVCHDYDLKPRIEVESHVRLVVLGRGSFGKRGPDRKIIKGSGTVEVKRAVLAWCAAHGFQTTSDDVGDACVLHEYVRRSPARRIK